MKKQPEITDATREAFVQVFCMLYQAKPIEKITVKEITEKAGYSRTTFYNYFMDTYDLLYQIEEEFLSHVMQAIQTNVEKNRILDDFIFTFFEIVSEQEQYGKVLLSNLYNTHFMNRLKREAVPLLMEAFHQSLENKRAAYAFEFYLPGILSVLSSWFQNGQDISVEELAQLIKGILKDGVLAQLE